MRKFLVLTLAALFLMSGVAFAGRVEKEIIMDTTFDATTTSDDSDIVNIGGADKASFFVNFVLTDAGGGVSATVNLEMSYDGIDFFDVDFLDHASKTTAQDMEVLSADTLYSFWIFEELCVPYARVNIDAYNTDANDLLDIEVYFVSKE